LIPLFVKHKFPFGYIEKTKGPPERVQPFLNHFYTQLFALAMFDNSQKRINAAQK